MSSGSISTQHCDHEDGCDEWTPDWYALTADNWRELMAGWQYDPRDGKDRAFCPKHAGDPR